MDLAGIWAFVAKDAPDQASNLVQEIIRKCETLLQHPEIGPRREELAPGLRVHFLKSYAIYYRVSETDLIVVHVVHGARDAMALFRQGDT